MQALVGGGLIKDEVAQLYRMTAREVRQQLAAVEFMDHLSPSSPLRTNQTIAAALSEMLDSHAGAFV
jgi:CMP-N-acetylneuraminic acid synthetase